MVQLHCFGESGNSYKVALMLTLCNVPWEPIVVDFFRGETRTPSFLNTMNPFGEAPVLDWHGERLTQSGVILQRLARETGSFRPAETDEDACWRWLLFDNHKFTAALATHRFLRCFAPKPVDPAVLAFTRTRSKAPYDLAEAHLADRPFVLGDEPTIADLSMAGYIFYPPEETGFELAETHPALDRWRNRLRALPGWRGPYDLMPRAYRPATV